MKKIILTALSIVTAIIIVYNLTNDVSNFEEGLSANFGMCQDAIELDDYDLLLDCKKLLDLQLELCDSYGNPASCSDPIIKQVELAIQSGPKQPMQDKSIDASAVELSTYINNEFNFSIKYPTGWTIDEDLTSSEFGIPIVGFKDRPSFPEILYTVDESHNFDGSFDVHYEKYKNGLGGRFDVSIDSERKTHIGHLEAYEIEYSFFISSDKCFNKEFLVNMGTFTPVLAFNRCSAETFERGLPLFERIALTFDSSNLD